MVAVRKYLLNSVQSEFMHLQNLLEELVMVALVVLSVQTILILC